MLRALEMSVYKLGDSGTESTENVYKISYFLVMFPVSKIKTEVHIFTAHEDQSLPQRLTSCQFTKWSSTIVYYYSYRFPWHYYDPLRDRIRWIIVNKQDRYFMELITMMLQN